MTKEIENKWPTYNGLHYRGLQVRNLTAAEPERNMYIYVFETLQLFW